MISKQLFANRGSRGFTIVEVAVVIVIISILVAIGGFVYNDYQQRANNDTRESRANIIASALERYYSENGEYPGVHMLIAGPDNNASKVADLLAIDESEIVDPSAPDGQTISIVNYNDYASSTDTVFRYRGFYSGADAYECLENTYIGKSSAPIASLEPIIAVLQPGYCEAFILSYRDTLDNTWKEIRSIHNPQLHP